MAIPTVFSLESGASFALNALIEADQVTELGAPPEQVGTLDQPDWAQEGPGLNGHRCDEARADA